MNLPPLVEILWGASFVVQLALCGILIAYRHFRRLPFFTAYVCLNVAQALFLYAIFRHYGDSSHAALLAGWWSEAITLLARVFATVEILHLVLSSYRGIWGLAWRLLAGTSAVVALICVGVAFQGHADAALVSADRGYNLIFATALISCLALIRYYLIRVDNVYKVLLAGFCFYACVKILLNTVLYDFLYHQHPSYPFIWQIFAVAPFVIVLIVWSAALLRPLPEKQKRRSLPTPMYGRISPEINLQLQAINRQLMNFFKIEEPQQ
jgi:hypothetical protein